MEPSGRRITAMDRPAPDPVKLLEAWMEWERGESTPGRVMSTLKTGGLRELLEQLAAASPPPSAGDAPPSTEAWTPVV
jgi:hypothetical protein